jgi:sulfur carrier protein
VISKATGYLPLASCNQPSNQPPVPARLPLRQPYLACEDQIQMKLVINGDDQLVDGPITLGALIEQLGMKSDRVAVELNLDIVPRQQWMETQLADGDRLEIVHFVGGGS